MNATATIMTQADAVTRYEARFAREIGVRHAVAFGYARGALVAILRAAGLREGDEVVLSPLTCKVVPLSLLAAGLKPVYADITADTLNLDASAAAAAVGPRTKALLFQQTYGLAGGAGAAGRLAADRGLAMVEDRAQCMPAAEPLVEGAIAAIYSNNPGKPLPAGSGGMAVLEDDRLARALHAQRPALARRSPGAALLLRLENRVRNHLPPGLYWTAYRAHLRLRPGGTRDTPEQELSAQRHAIAMQISAGEAAQGDRWMDRLDGVRSHRSACCAYYSHALEPVAALRTIRNARGPLYYYPVLVEDKPELLRRARTRRVQIVPWPVRTPIYPIENEAALERYGYTPGSCAVAEDVARRLVGLPTDLTIGASHLEAVARLVAGG